AAEVLGTALFHRLVDRNEEANERREYARLFNAMIQGPLAVNFGAAKEEAITALKAIERLVPKATDSEVESKGFVVTVFDHSPRLLLTVGDLVPTNSCQNYKTGGVIRTLPAYAVDANV